MSFWPFPKTLLAELKAAAGLGPAVELGVGDGRLAARLRSAGIPILGADRVPPCDLRLDATALPFARASLGLVVAGNLLRHLPPPAREAVVLEAARALKPGGVALLLEDHPAGRNAAETNYRRTLELLAAVDPSRGAALDLAVVVEALPRGLFEVGWSGEVENGERPRQPELPLDWAAVRPGVPAGLVAGLRRDVLEQGMEYGLFQAVLLRRAEGVGPE
jgi:SAM-dependent methyltransferase